MQSAVEAAWAAWDPAQAKPEEEQAPNLLEAARLKQSVAQFGRAGSSHSGSYAGSSNKSPVPSYSARNPAGSTSVMQAPARPPSTTSTAFKRSTASHPMPIGKEDFPASPKSQSRQTWTNGPTRLASPPISISCKPALEASMSNSNSNGWEIPVAGIDTASGWEMSTPIQQTSACPARNTAATTITASTSTLPESDITRTITLPPSFDKSDAMTASLSRLVCRLENDPRYEDRVNLKLKTPPSAEWYILMDGPAADVQGIEKEIREWLDQNCAPLNKQENAADILQKLQGVPSSTSSIHANGFPEHQHNTPLPPFSPPTSAQQAPKPVPALVGPSTSSGVHGHGRLPVTEPSLVPPQANVKVARSAEPLQEQALPTIAPALSMSPPNLHNGRYVPEQASPPQQAKPQRQYFGSLSIPLSPPLVARFGPLIKDFERLLGLKRAYIENYFLRLHTYSGLNDRHLEVARRTLAILARCSIPAYTTGSRDFQLSEDDLRILKQIRGPHLSRPIPDTWLINIGRQLKEAVEQLIPSQAAVITSAQRDNVQEAQKSPQQPSLSVHIPWNIMRYICRRARESQSLGGVFDVLCVDSISWDKEGDEMLVFTDKSESKIDFVRRAMSIFLRITQWQDELSGRSMALGPIEQEVRDGIMRQKDRLKGNHPPERLQMVVRKLTEAYKYGGWQEEVLGLQNKEQQEVPHGFKDSGSWSQASEVKQDQTVPASVDSLGSAELPRNGKLAHSSLTKPDTASPNPNEVGFGWITTDVKNTNACIESQEHISHQSLTSQQANTYAEERINTLPECEADMEQTEEIQKSADEGQSSKRFKVTKVGLAPIMALRDEVPLEEITDDDHYLILHDSDAVNVQVAYDSLRILTLLPGNIVNGEDLSPLPSNLQQIFLQHRDSKLWQRRSVATKIAVVVAAIRTAHEVQSHTKEMERNEATHDTFQHLLDRVTPASEIKVVEDTVNGTSSAVPDSDGSVKQVDSVAAQVDKLARDEAVTELGAESLWKSVHLVTSGTGRATRDGQQDGHAQCTTPLSPSVSPESADNAPSPTLEELRFYARLRTPQNSISWRLPSHPHRGRLVGRRGRNMNLIRSISGVVAMSSVMVPRNPDLREFYILSSHNPVANSQERHDLSIALKLFNILCKFHGLSELGITSYHYNRVRLPNESRLTFQDLSLCDKYRKASQVAQVDQVDIVAVWDSQLHKLLLEVAEVYKYKHAETDIESDIEPVEYMVLPPVETSDPDYHIKTGYMAQAEEAHEWQDLDELWKNGREDLRLRLRGSNEKALLRVADAMLSLGLQVPLSSSDDIGPSASLVGWDEDTDQVEAKPQKLEPGWSCGVDNSPANANVLVETWTAGLPEPPSSLEEAVFPPQDLLYQRSTSPAAPMREIPHYTGGTGFYIKSSGEHPKYHVQLPSDAKYLVKIIGTQNEYVHYVSAVTHTHLEVVSQREARGLSHTIFIYGHAQRAEDALKYIVGRIKNILPTWKFLSDPAVNAMIENWAMEEGCRGNSTAALPKARPQGNLWIQEGTGLPIYIVHVPEEVLGNVRLAIKSNDFAKIQVEIAESLDLPGKLDLYGTQPNCEKAVLRLREIARSHDPEWMPGGDANIIVERQDAEERANAALQGPGRELQLASPTTNGTYNAHAGWTSLQNYSRHRKESSRSIEAPATGGWSTFTAPGWDTQDPNAAHVQFPKITNQAYSSTFHAHKDGSVSSKDYFSQTGREHMTTRSWHVPSTLLQQGAAPKIRLQ